MTFLNSILSIGGCVLLTMHATAQLTWSTPEIMADSGDVVTIDFAPTGYQDIVSSQGTIQFDPTVLEYMQVDNFALASISSNSFGEGQVSTGILTFSWFESDLVGKSIGDNVPAFTMQFKVIGNPGDSSMIDLIDSPTLAEFADDSFNTLTFDYSEGKVKINDVLSLKKLDKKMFNVYPNPATDWVQIEGNSMGGMLEVFWYSMNGELVKSEFIESSKNKIKLTTNELNRGMYLMQIGNKAEGFESRLIEIL